MPKTVEVEFPVLVTVTVPDGYDMAKEDIVELAFEVVSQQCSRCIGAKDGHPVEWASCVAEVLTDEATIDGEYVGETAGPLPPQCQGGSGCTCCGPDCDCGCIEKCPAYKRLSAVYVPPRNQGKTMMSEVPSCEGWRLLGPDESVDGFGDEHKTSEGVWVKMPPYFTLWKAKDFIAVRRRIPAKPEPIKIRDTLIKCNSFNDVMRSTNQDVSLFIGNAAEARQLADWLTRYADWREAQEFVAKTPPN